MSKIGSLLGGRRFWGGVVARRPNRSYATAVDHQGARVTARSEGISVVEWSEYREIALSIQQQSEQEVRLVGGYWPVQVALAGIGHELGACSEAMARDDSEAYSRSLVTALWLSTCIANQYCVSLSGQAIELWEGDCSLEEGSKSDAAVVGAFLSVVGAYGQLCDTVNRYESAVYRRDEPSVPVGKTVVRMHRSIIHIVDMTSYSVHDLVRDRVDRVRSFRGRVDMPSEPRYDPSYADSVLSFRDVAGATACPYGKTARIWGMPDWERADSARKNVGRITPVLLRFVHVAPNEGLDGAVIRVAGIRSLDDLCQYLRTLLTELGRSPAHPSAMNVDPDLPGWVYSVHGMEFFVAVFSSIYDDRHPRYSCSSEYSYVLLQPRFAFKRRDLGDKDMIRKRFAERSQDYQALSEKERGREALKFVKPMSLEGEPVRWWLDT